jgi:hypothetical protein
MAPLDSHAGLLPPEVAWSYRAGRLVAASRPPGPELPLVVANAEPPRSRGLERLPAWKSALPVTPRPIELSGAEATPVRLLAELPQATSLELHAHGLIDQGVSVASLIALTPDREGRFALTAEEIRKQNLARAPTVLLAACGAARMSPFLHESFSLPTAFVAAGAREVFAATADIPHSAGRFFSAVRSRISEGADPAVALRDERMQWHQAEPEQRWVDSVLLFR